MCGFRRRKIHMIASMMMNASENPTIGEAIIGMTTFSRMVCHSIVTPAGQPGADQPADQRVRGGGRAGRSTT